MPRIIVTSDPSPLPDDTSILLDESVRSVHLSTGHAAAQLVERLAWAISDAEDLESGGHARGEAPSRPARRVPRRPSGPAARRRVPVVA
ncbi:MAG TPA: hypothetical protein VGN08_04580 [Solirubrobacteraceae bacterium]|jgi:hypothetical protein